MCSEGMLSFGLNFDFVGQHSEKMLLALGGLPFGGNFEINF
jgi:hypothetical protein